MLSMRLGAVNVVTVVAERRLSKPTCCSAYMPAQQGVLVHSTQCSTSLERIETEHRSSELCGCAQPFGHDGSPEQVLQLPAITHCLLQASVPNMEDDDEDGSEVELDDSSLSEGSSQEMSAAPPTASPSAAPSAAPSPPASAPAAPEPSEADPSQMPSQMLADAEAEAEAEADVDAGADAEAGDPEEQLPDPSGPETMEVEVAQAEASQAAAAPKPQPAPSTRCLI